MKQKINIGIDIGPTSVAIAATNEECKIIGKPTIFRFKDACDEKTGGVNNASRRDYRHFHRRLSRKKTLFSDFRKMLKTFNIQLPVDFFKHISSCTKTPPWILKIDVIQGKEISLEEKIFCLYHYLHHRGSFNKSPTSLAENYLNKEKIGFELNDIKYKLNKNGYHDVEYVSYQISSDISDEQKNKLKNKIAKIYNIAIKDIENKIFIDGEIEISKSIKIPSFKQKDNYERNGYVANSVENQVFTNDEWRKEIELFFKKCPEFNENFKKMFLILFTRHRDYDKGPGSEKSPTKYGLYEKNSNGDVEKKYDVLWTKTIRKEMYKGKEKNCACKHSSSAELFNLLNDLNNLRINEDPEWRVNKNIKDQIIEKILGSKKYTITATDIKKIIKEKAGLKKVTLKSLDDKSKITSLFNTCVFSKIMKLSIHQIFLQDNIAKLNKFANILSQSSEDNFWEKITKEVNIDSEDYDLMNLLKDNLKIYRKSHSWCEEHLNDFIPKLYNAEKGENQMNFIELEENEQGIDATTLKIKNDETKNILNNIMSPSVKKAVGYSFKLINAYLHKVKKEYDVESICIELTRSNNSKEERENITEMQKKNKEDRDVLNDSLSEEEVKRIEGISNSNFTKALLWIIQEGKDAYDGQPIEYNELINNPKKYQIDHILPQSWSFDNSRSNKVLTSAANNAAKGNKTPYMFLGENKFNEMCETYWKDWFKDEKYKAKFDKLVDKRPENEIKQEFVGRNLSDTGWIGKELYEFLKTKYEENTEKQIKILPGNGRFTSYVRNSLNLWIDAEKKRDEYKHHGIDACCISLINTLPNNIKTTIQKYYRGDNEIDNFENKWLEDFRQKLNDIRGDWQRFVTQEENFNFSTPLIKHASKSLLKNVSPIKTKDGYSLKSCNILSNDKEEIKWLKKIFYDNDEKEIKNLLIYKTDIKTFNMLKKIFNNNYNPDDKKNDNPFVKYMNDKETFGPDHEYKYVKILKDENEHFNKEVNIKKLWYYSAKTSNNFKKNNSFFSGLNWKYLMVFRKNDEFIFVPKNLINKYKETFDKYTAQGYKYFDTLYKGSKFIANEDNRNFRKGELVEVTGVSGQQIELKSLIRALKGQQFCLTKQLYRKFTKVNVNLLGEKYKNE